MFDHLQIHLNLASRYILNLYHQQSQFQDTCQTELSHSGDDDADAGVSNEESSGEEYPAQALCIVGRADLPGNTDAHG